MNHRSAWDLIPWLVNGTVAENDRADLQHHVQNCAACREEIETQRALLQGMRTRPQVESMPHGSLQKLWQRIDAQQFDGPADAAMHDTSATAATSAIPPTSVIHPASAQRAARSPRALRWLAAAVVLQAVLLGILATILLRGPQGQTDGAYRTVSTPAAVPGPASVRAVFSPDMTLGELQALLERAHLRIVNGPSPDGVYTLATASRTDDPKQALLTLRAHPGARFAEPIDAERP
jgi:hypothetical protein